MLDKNILPKTDKSLIALGGEFESLDKAQLLNAKTCPICSASFRKIDSLKTINPNSRDELELCECGSCQHWFINPLPKQKYLSELYAENSLFVVLDDYENKFPTEEEKEDAERYLAIVESSISKTDFNFLEIGVGRGEVFKHFSKKASMSYGVEPGTRKPLSSGIVSDIDEIPKGITFDVIVIQDVLEHLTDPAAMLARLRALASAGSTITCGFPNKDCLLAAVTKRRWRMVLPIGHLHFFSKKSVFKIFDSSGWQITSLRRCRPGHVPVGVLLKRFDRTSFKNPKSGIIKLAKLFGKIFLGRDQWLIQARASGDFR